jgi:hypothetical protein
MTAAVELDGLRDRIAVTDALYRYGSCIDEGDVAGLRAVLADDLSARYGNAEPIVGGDAVAAWIAASTQGVLWQHHMLSVYHVDPAGDQARALVYHTSHRVFARDPTTANVLVGRYRNELRRCPDGWRISRLVLEVLWAERRTDATGLLLELGGPSLP